MESFGVHGVRMVRRRRGLGALALLLACGVVSPPPSAAQASRAEAIALEQQAKAGHLEVEGPSDLERGMVWAQRSPLIALTSGPYPLAGNVYPGTGLGAGAGYIKRWPGGAHVNGAAEIAVRGSSLLAASARMPAIAGGRVTVVLEARHVVAKDLSFYGVGSNSSRDLVVPYEYRPTAFGATVAVHPLRWFELSGAYERLTLRTTIFPPSAPAEATGLGGKLTYNKLEGGAAIDWRTSPGYSTRGGFHRLTWSRYFEAQDRPFAFHEIEYEGTQLVPILREQFVLAGRVLTTLATAEDGDDVPVILAPTLGDAETLRGFRERRFTDRNRLLLTGEYRWRPSRYLDMVIYFDAGKVGPRRKDLGLSHLESDWGLGGRIHGPKLVAVRLEVARSREGWEGIFALGKAF